MTAIVGGDTKAVTTSDLRYLVMASSVGTMIEWYDFFLYGALAVFFSGLFFPPGNPTAALLISVATFGTGFAVRPLGAVIFGRLGDRIGRKSVFLFTLLLMGASTSLIGLLPSFKVAGYLAPLGLVLLRLAQGLAVGGQYGGAAIYVGEHAPPHQRGAWTSFIQVMGAGGFLASLVVVLAVRLALGDAAFSAWGWRLPFLFSLVLVAWSLRVRMRLTESPIYKKMQAEGRTSASPLKDTFSDPANRRTMLTMLFGLAIGQSVGFYTGQFYALYFIQNVLKIDFVSASLTMIVAVACALPAFYLFGALSDRIGRKQLMMGGIAFAGFSYLPLYMLMHWAAKAPGGPNLFLIGLSVFIQVVVIALIYGPYAAYIVELFPARVRYTSISVPYHIGNGIFGGFVPFIGLAYPIVMSLMSATVGWLTLPETLNRDIG